jgi:CelD/BcsL family acetyltransferase involved in cellulose biosynthesis
MADPERALDTEMIADPARLPALLRACDALVDDAAPGAIFQSSAWLEPWWRSFGEGRRLCFLAVARGSRLIGALPAYAQPTIFGGERLRLLGDGIVASDHLGTIAGPSDRGAVAVAIAAHLARTTYDLTFDHLSADDPLVGALTRAGAAMGARVDRRRTIACPYVSLTGSAKSFFAGRPRGAGKQLQRRRRWLEKLPGFKIEIATRPDAIAGAMEELFRLHVARWATGGGGDGLTSPGALVFHREAARRLAARNQARLYLLHADGAVRAALYGFGRGPRFAYYQSGHERSWRQRSVGSVLLGAVIEDCFARGLEELDLLCGEEPYKATFATGARELITLRLSRGKRATLLRSVERAADLGRSWIRAARSRRRAR